MIFRNNRMAHTAEEIKRIRVAAAATGKVRDDLAALIRPGMTTREVDELAGSLIAETGGRSAFFNYAGYPGQVCISVNEEVVHGIGVPTRVLQEEDIVSLDIGVALDGACGDCAVTVALGEHIPAEVERLLEGTRKALEAGIDAARPGNYIRHISAAVEKTAGAYKLGVVRDYVGHGCGIKLHEPPEIPNFVAPGKGPQLVPGMVLAIEPMLTLGTWRVDTDRTDHWTVRTHDGSLSAHFEHMVLVTESNPEILTWPKTM